MKLFKKIQSKFIVPVIITVSIVFGILGIYFYITESNNKTTETDHSVEEILNGRAEQLGSIVYGLIDQAFLYAQKPEIKALNVNNLSDALKNIKLNKYVKEIVVVLEDGTITTAKKHNPNSNLKQRNYYKAIFEDKKDYFIYDVISSIDSSRLFGISLPIFDKKGDRKGIMGLSMDLYNFSKIVTDPINVMNGYAFVFDNEGKIIMHPNRKFILKSDMINKIGWSGLKEIYTKSKNEEKGKQVFYNDKNEKFISFYEKIPNTGGWTLVMAIPDKHMKAATLRLLYTIVMGFIVALMLTILVIWYINAYVVIKPIIKVEKFISGMSKGEIHATLEYTNDDEIGSLSKSLNITVAKIREVITGVITSSENFVSSSRELSMSAQQISSGANQQAAASEEISSSIEQFTSSVTQTADNAGLTEKIATQATDSIKTANDSVVRTIQAMRTIIQKISVIKEIAEKTDLLAVNAAIESARAGEYGKGFAVVASEVRKLAEHSQKAAKEIDEISMTSVQTAELSGKLLAEVIPQIQNTAKLVQEISATSMEQNSGVNQISQSIQQLTSIVQQNSALSEELASSSEEVSAQAQLLLENVSYFKISQEEIDIQTDMDLENEIRKLSQLLELRHKQQEVLSKTLVKQESKQKVENKPETAETVQKGIQLDIEDHNDEKFDKF